MVINQYEIYWTDLDPTRGSEIQKTRPCVIITPNEMNHNINTVIIAPLTLKEEIAQSTNISFILLLIFKISSSSNTPAFFTNLALSIHLI